MRVVWSAGARRDLVRVHDFLAPKNVPAAGRAVAALVEAPLRLAEIPRLGTRVDTLPEREVRRLVVARQYEMRYEVRDGFVVILRIFHTREDR